MLTIKLIEGNSKEGNPVFSHAGMCSNYTILAFQPSYDEKHARIMKNTNAKDPMQQQIKDYNNMAGYLSSEKD